VGTVYNSTGNIYFEKEDQIKALGYYQLALISQVRDFTEYNIYINPTIEVVNSKTVLLSTLVGKAEALERLWL